MLIATGTKPPFFSVPETVIKRLDRIPVWQEGMLESSAKVSDNMCVNVYKSDLVTSMQEVVFVFVLSSLMKQGISTSSVVLTNTHFPTAHNVSSGVCKTGTIRLVGSALEYAGRVEVCINSEWSAVCDSNWDSTAARIVCRQLRFNSSRKCEQGV